MSFKELEEAVKEDNLTRLKERLEKIKTEEGLKLLLGQHNKNYKGNITKKLKKYLTNKSNKNIEQELREIQEINESEEFNSELVITIEWKKSYMWGTNPRAYTNYGFTSESIGGCGYDKKSTALAQALNSHKPLLKLLYEKKNNALKNPKTEYTGVNGDKGTHQSQINQEVLGYGSGYRILPYFEGGVGTNSHKRIIEGLGLSFGHITNTPNTDVFIISKKANK